MNLESHIVHIKIKVFSNREQSKVNVGLQGSSNVVTVCWCGARHTTNIKPLCILGEKSSTNYK